ncbi:MAG: DUF2207 domain-containing protein [Hyphomicrobiales bacterium]|nr:DUF2207 domain-containing protein [Hyphomicrobiales bacterium]
MKVLAAAVVMIAVAAGLAVAEERIVSFESDVVVMADGVLDVTETITVVAEEDRIKRGIFRDFPLTFVDDDGITRRVSFSIQDITRDGAAEPYHTASNANGIRIYIGEEDVLIPAGTYAYSIRYETGRQIRFRDTETELFWNVTGNDWAFPIDAVTARFALPDDQPPVRWTAFTGRFGDPGDAFTGSVAGDGQLTVTTTAPLAPREGLSVAIEIPPGLIASPSGAQAFGYWFLDNRRFVLGGVGLIGVLIFYVFIWRAVGRDPPKGTIIPLFHPPDGISPALAGYVRDFGWRGGWREFTAAALSLAVKGLMVFDDSGEDIVLSRTEADLPAKGLPPGESAIYRWVKGRGGKVTINKSSGKSLSSAFKGFKSAVENENRGRFFKRNTGYLILGLALTALVIFLVLVFGDLPEAEIGLLIASVVIGVFLGVFVIPLVRALLGSRSVGTTVAVGFNLIVLVVIGAGFVSTIGGVGAVLPDGYGTSLLRAIAANGFPLMLVVGFAAMNGVFYYLLRAPTAAGRVVMDHIEGLELYIRTAESNRMNLVGAPDLDATQFERLLPYAVALDAEKPWSEAFEAAFSRAQSTDSGRSGYRPAWRGGHGWGGRSIASSIASTVSSAQSSFVSSIPAPKSSSSGFSGGGGSSGGGGGGGGGGGW